jgi:hypothetical protein
MPNRKSLFPNLFLLLTMCLTVVFSQVQAASPADSARVQALMDSAFYYRSFDLERTRVLLQDALDLAQELKMDKTAAEGNNRLGLTCVLLGDYPAAAVYLNEARQFFEGNGLKAGQSVNLLPRKGRCQIGDFINMYGFIESLNITWDNESPWEITPGIQAPLYSNISISFEKLIESPSSGGGRTGMAITDDQVTRQRSSGDPITNLLLR